MAQHQDKNCGCEEDGCADALATILIIAIVVAAASFWLHGMT